MTSLLRHLVRPDARASRLDLQLGEAAPRRLTAPPTAHPSQVTRDPGLNPASGRRLGMPTRDAQDHHHHRDRERQEANDPYQESTQALHHWSGRRPGTRTTAPIAARPEQATRSRAPARPDLVITTRGERQQIADPGGVILPGGSGRRRTRSSPQRTCSRLRPLSWPRASKLPLGLALHESAWGSAHGPVAERSRRRETVPCASGRCRPEAEEVRPTDWPDLQCPAFRARSSARIFGSRQGRSRSVPAGATARGPEGHGTAEGERRTIPMARTPGPGHRARPVSTSQEAACPSPGQASA